MRNVLQVINYNFRRPWTRTWSSKRSILNGKNDPFRQFTSMLMVFLLLMTKSMNTFFPRFAWSVMVDYSQVWLRDTLVQFLCTTNCDLFATVALWEGFFSSISSAISHRVVIESGHTVWHIHTHFALQIVRYAVDFQHNYDCINDIIISKTPSFANITKNNW